MNLVVRSLGKKVYDEKQNGILFFIINLFRR